MSRYQHQMPALERRLSIEETYYLADMARRKSTAQTVRNDLRLKLGHAHTLERLEHAIRTSPPSSPRQSSVTASRQPISYASLESKRAPSPPPSIPSAAEVDEYGYSYDDGEEDFGGLSLMRTESRRS